MRELLKTNDPILLSFATSPLKEAGLAYHVADTHISIVEGSIGAFPRRLLVLEADETQARRLLLDAGLADELHVESQAETPAASGWRPLIKPA